MFTYFFLLLSKENITTPQVKHWVTDDSLAVDTELTPKTGMYYRMHGNVTSRVKKGKLVRGEETINVAKMKGNLKSQQKPTCQSHRTEAFCRPAVSSMPLIYVYNIY